MKMLNITEGILLKLNYPAQIGATPSEQNVGKISLPIQIIPELLSDMATPEVQTVITEMAVQQIQMTFR